MSNRGGYLYFGGPSMTPLSTVAQKERYFSRYGIATFADHDRDDVADDSVLSDCSTYATSVLVGMLSTRYTLDNLRLSEMLVEIDCIIAIRELCLRRGNSPPKSLEFRYQELLGPGGLIDKIRSGQLQLVDSNGDLIRSKGRYSPVFSNLEIDRRYPHERVRVVRQSSNRNQTQLEQDTNDFDWGTGGTLE